MYANVKDRKIAFAINISGTGVIVGSTVDLRKSNRVVDEFAVAVKGFGINKISPTLLNGGMETAGAPLASWTYATGGTTAITQDATTPHGGTKSAKWVIDATHDVATLKQAVCTIGRTYVVSFWAKGAVGGEKVDILDGATVVQTFILTNAYALYSCLGHVATSTSVGIGSTSDAANNSATFYVDDVTVADTVPFSLAPTTLTAKLEASLDGVYWTSLQAIAQTDDGNILIVANKPADYFRFNVTAFVAAGDALDYVTFSLLGA